MTIDEIVSKLKFSDGSFPKATLMSAIQNKDLITPRLLQEIKYAKDNIQAIYEDETYSMHFYALYLLAQFRETKAFPLIIDFFSIPGEITVDVASDLVTQDLGRILASTYDGDVGKLKKLIEDENVNLYVRSATINAMVILWGYKLLSRKEIIEYFHFLLVEKLKNSDPSILAALITKSLVLSPIELKIEIEKAFKRDAVDNFYLTIKETQACYALSNEEAIINFNNKESNHLISDVIEELQSWSSFNIEDKVEDSLIMLGNNKDNSNFSKNDDKIISQAPYLRNEIIGRNDPCVCGSGKKYKKCCFK